MLRLQTLGQGVWLDECISIYVAKMPDLTSMIATLSIQDFNPPLSHLILRYVIQYFGDGPVVVKIPALLCNLAMIPALIWLGSSVGSYRLGVIAALFCALSPLSNHFSCQSRPYSIAMLTVCLSLCFFINALKASALKARISYMTGFVISTALCLYSHTVCVLIMPCYAVAYLWIWGLKKEHYLRWHEFMACMTLAILPFLLWIPVILEQMSLPRWIEATRLSQMWFVYFYDYVMFAPFAPLHGIFFAGIALILALCFAARQILKNGFGSWLTQCRTAIGRLDAPWIVIVCTTAIPAFLVGYLTPFAMGYFRYILPFSAGGFIFWACVIDRALGIKGKNNHSLVWTTLFWLMLAGLDIGWVAVTHQKPDSGLRTMAMDAKAGLYDGAAIMIAPDVTGPSFDYYMPIAERARHKVLLCGFTRWEPSKPCALKDLFAAWQPDSVVADGQKHVLDLAVGGVKKLVFARDRVIMSTPQVPKTKRIDQMQAWLNEHYGRLPSPVSYYDGMTEQMQITIYDLEQDLASRSSQRL